MTSKEVINYVRENLGIRLTMPMLWRWKQGWYPHPRTHVQTWFFEDHATLPFTNKGGYKGFEFELDDVLGWVVKLREKTQGRTQV